LAFCLKCGMKLPEGAAFCPSCGVPQQMVATSRAKDHSDLATALVLIGGVLGLLFALFSLVVIPFFARMMGYGLGMMGQYGGFGMMGYPRFGMLVGGMMMLWSGVGLVGALLAIYSGVKLRQTYAKSAATVGIVGGVLLLMTFSWLPGLIVLAGSILAYVEYARRNT